MTSCNENNLKVPRWPSYIDGSRRVSKPTKTAVFEAKLFSSISHHPPSTVHQHCLVITRNTYSQCTPCVLYSRSTAFIFNCITPLDTTIAEDTLHPPGPSNLPGDAHTQPLHETAHALVKARISAPLHSPAQRHTHGKSPCQGRRQQGPCPCFQLGSMIARPRSCSSLRCPMPTTRMPPPKAPLTRVSARCWSM